MVLDVISTSAHFIVSESSSSNVHLLCSGCVSKGGLKRMILTEFTDPAD